MLTWAWEQQRDDRQALTHATRTLDLCRALGQPVREAEALNQMGWCLAQLSDFDTARAHCEAALAIQRRHHDPGEEATLDSLGYIAHHSGHHQQAIEYYQQALPLITDLGHILHTADTLDNLGHPHAALGEYDQARAVWRKALELYRQQGREHDADKARRRLEALDHIS
jgi:tetratricopeptide (TPR) repeat protein